MQKAFSVLERLQDGRVHSGEDIATGLGVSRSAVWNQIKRLQVEGVEVHAVSGKGYRLPGAMNFSHARQYTPSLPTSQWRDYVKYMSTS